MEKEAKVNGAVAAAPLRVLSVDEMLAAEDVSYAEIEAWGGIVRVGSLTADEMIDFIEANEGVEKRNAGLRLIVRSLVDADGKRIGTEAHVKAFGKKDAGLTSKVVNRILELNGLDKKKAEEAKKD